MRSERTSEGNDLPGVSLLRSFIKKSSLHLCRLTVLKIPEKGKPFSRTPIFRTLAYFQPPTLLLQAWLSTPEHKPLEHSLLANYPLLKLPRGDFFI